VGNGLSALFGDLPLPSDTEVENTPSLFIEEAQQTNSQSFGDILSLAIIQLMSDISWI
jgi:hypothetical protein